MTEVPIIQELVLYLQSQPINWFLYDRDLRHESVNPFHTNVPFLHPLKTSAFLTFPGELALKDRCEMS